MHDVLVTELSVMEDALETDLGKKLALLLSSGLENHRELIAGCVLTQWAGVLDPTVKDKLLNKHGDAGAMMDEMCVHIDIYYPCPLPSPSQAGSANSSEKDGYKSLKRRHNGNMVQGQATLESSSQLRKYLSEPAVPISETDDENDEQNPLAYWKLHQQRFPQLAKFARDILAIPATTVASESAFSRSKLLVTDRRTRLNKTSVSALMFLDDWYHRSQPSSSPRQLAMLTGRSPSGRAGRASSLW
ncbi:unnamed protein product [Tilletia controversa]|uniref:HAT C-terminal dimerisation domain-containing protein n=1 Tax=Tilletia controversa TaxID=13291 RepID=A0A8X7SUL7_9BASI|nr:hypothetical protein CF336_g5594 [Tilletia laevis]KAE8198627.1 hypothetical protein CF328_g3494 [Tilletia controversa]KAE8242971.1 hypothetical protein A4X06_0g6640 [Tilletia controversa]CAD6919423.1 unnamed protein product [Tilletia controversa]